ncbi:MAG: hypothetical protein WDN23_19420 [Edaphobacter sp.]
MKKLWFRTGALVAALAAGASGLCVAQDRGAPGSDGLAGKRPMTFADLQRMKRVSDPQISSSGRWVMFSVTDVDLEKNSKVNHLWVAPMGADQGGRGAAGYVLERRGVGREVFAGRAACAVCGDG